ncbi:protein prenylyltransferase [Xylariomycetidae sp. FL0641]|nr:protein prenylyltransferase [Xylariomycetidae sp. FL0641]
MTPKKNKGASKAGQGNAKQQQPIASTPTASTSDPEPTSKPPSPAEAKTVREHAWAVYYETNPWAWAYETRGLSRMSAAEVQGWTLQKQIQAHGRVEQTSPTKRAQKDLYRAASELGVPWRSAPRPHDGQWGTDWRGRDRGDYSLEQWRAFEEKQRRLLELKKQSQRFKDVRDAHARGKRDWRTGEVYAFDQEKENADERKRREEMADLNQDLYGAKMASYALDPDWDDVTPIPQVEPEGALAAIAYPDDYSESMGYLRAVMAANEQSKRCLKLTEHIISMNPAHYTVWLYRFELVKALDIPIPDELAWLNGVSLQHLKNYQIWHHRQQLMEHYVPSLISSSSTTDEAAAAGGEKKAKANPALVQLATSERRFLQRMLDEDTKNYHVWTYRQYLIRKVGGWGLAELSSAAAMIDGDVRNNSAWSHRFFLVFSDPAHTSEPARLGARTPDPALPASVIDREVDYAQKKIRDAPQNQSPWNYLRGVLAKAARPLGSVKAFAEEFVHDLGKGEDEEKVASSHALDLLADIAKEEGDREKARLCLERLADKWDPIRKGYWAYRVRLLDS